MKIQRPLDGEALKETDTTEAIIAAAWGNAVQFVVDNGNSGIPEDAPSVEPSGAAFTIPLLIPEGSLSGDDRMILEKALTTRLLPLSLLWQEKTAAGHDGAVIVGRIDSIERVANGLGNAKGVFDVGVWGREAERLVRGGFLRGISADLDEFRASIADAPNDEFSDDSEIRNEQIRVNKARLMGATLVAYPAFQECTIMLDTNPSLADGTETLADGLHEASLDDIDNELAAIAASAAPIVPPKSWFSNPKLNGPTPLTIDDDGKVYGHIAAWHVNHIGYANKAQRPPRSASKYAYFRTGVVRTDDGTDVAVGQLTLAGGHASMSANARDAVKHYDDTASAVADVIAGEDSFGIWVAGALRPDVTPSQVRALRASAPSGDWRPINGRLELVAVCQVNVPGFPTVRTMIASGQVTALVAAGAAPLAELREASSLGLQSIEERLRQIEAREQRAETERLHELAMRKMEPLLRQQEEEASQLASLAASAMERMEAHITKRDSELAAQIQAATERMSRFM
jgi:hypothetical protein